MSRNGSGTYVPPVGNPVSPGTTIQAAWANSIVTDMGSEITNSLPRDGQAPMNGVLRIVDGVSSAPGLMFNSDSSTGVYRPGANLFGIAVGSAPKLILGLPQNNGYGRWVFDHTSYTPTVSNPYGVIFQHSNVWSNSDFYGSNTVIVDALGQDNNQPLFITRKRVSDSSLGNAASFIIQNLGGSTITSTSTFAVDFEMVTPNTLVNAYNGKWELGVLSGSSAFVDRRLNGNFYLASRRGPQHPSGANTGFEQTHKFYALTSGGQIESFGNGLSFNPLYTNTGAAITLDNSYAQSNFNIRSSAGDATGLIQTTNGSSLASLQVVGYSGSYFQMRASAGQSQVYSTSDTGDAFVTIRSNYTTPSAKSSVLQLLTSGASEDWRVMANGVNGRFNIRNYTGGVTTESIDIDPARDGLLIIYQHSDYTKGALQFGSTASGKLAYDNTKFILSNDLSVNGSVTAVSASSFSGGMTISGVTSITGATTINGGGSSLVQATTGDVSAGASVFHRWNDINGNAGYAGFGGSANTLTLQNYKAGPISLATNAIARMTVNATGGVTINVPTSGVGLTVSGGGASITGAITGTMTIDVPSGGLRTASHISRFESSEQAAGAGTSFSTSVSHGGSRKPDFARAVLRCKTAELGYSVGDEVTVEGETTNSSASTWASATDIGLVYRRGGTMVVNDKGTQAAAGITTANWKLVFYAHWL